MIYSVIFFSSSRSLNPPSSPWNEGLCNLQHLDNGCFSSELDLNHQQFVLESHLEEHQHLTQAEHHQDYLDLALPDIGHLGLVVCLYHHKYSLDML